jgi:hypothetical protein
MKISEAVHHIKQTHAGIAGGLRKEAEHHRNMSNFHMAALGKAAGDDFHKCAKAEHDDMATDRETRAKYHDDMMSECDKALKTLTADDLNKNAPDDLAKRVTALENTVIPTRVSAIAPENPNLRTVTRTGQRQIGEAQPAVPVQFEKLVLIEE